MNRADGDEQPRAYALRFTERAQRDLDAATYHFAVTASPEIAVSWREGLYTAMAALALYPRRCPTAPEKFRREVRQYLYRRPGSHVIYRILFTIAGEEVAAQDAPTVNILHVRHASTRPLSRTQTREIETEL